MLGGSPPVRLYARQRPQLLVDWLDGGSSGVDDDLEWQAHLWRALVETVGIDPPHVRHAKAVDSLRNNATDLPSRISLFGHTRLPPPTSSCWVRWPPTTTCTCGCRIRAQHFGPS